MSLAPLTLLQLRADIELLTGFLEDGGMWSVGSPTTSPRAVSPRSLSPRDAANASTSATGDNSGRSDSREVSPSASRSNTTSESVSSGHGGTSDAALPRTAAPASSAADPPSAADGEAASPVKLTRRTPVTAEKRKSIIGLCHFSD